MTTFIISNEEMCDAIKITISSKECHLSTKSVS